MGAGIEMIAAWRAMASFLPGVKTEDDPGVPAIYVAEAAFQITPFGVSLSWGAALRLLAYVFVAFGTVLFGHLLALECQLMKLVCC